jgi:hypothetical protein
MNAVEGFWRALERSDSDAQRRIKGDIDPLIFLL